MMFAPLECQWPPEGYWMQLVSFALKTILKIIKLQYSIPSVNCEKTNISLKRTIYYWFAKNVMRNTDTFDNRSVFFSITWVQKQWVLHSRDLKKHMNHFVRLCERRNVWESAVGFPCSQSVILIQIYSSYLHKWVQILFSEWFGLLCKGSTENPSYCMVTSFHSSSSG